MNKQIEDLKKAKADIMKDLKRKQVSSVQRQPDPDNDVQRSRYFKSYLMCIEKQSEDILNNIRKRRNLFSNLGGENPHTLETSRPPTFVASGLENKPLLQYLAQRKMLTGAQPPEVP